MLQPLVPRSAPAHPALQPAKPEKPANSLLALLSASDLNELKPHLEPVHLQLGDRIYAPRVRQNHAYFPTTAIVSLHHVLDSGASAEVASVGHEGMVGVCIFMGGESSANSGMVQVAGSALRIARLPLQNAFMRGGMFQKALLLYTQGLSNHIMWTAACNRHHRIDQQLCRWLLLTLDRCTDAELIITQELVANTLGVRREAITEAAGKLQQAGLIRYRRGHITVLDRAGLEARVCECYASISSEMRRLMQNIA
ncbi:MAG: Crp/Fnr family transcriptional regulator [Chitinophagaceae bacterium]|nr:Crp/Fnr family transcriptional regulator [Polaromonas sp.]